MIAVCGSRSFHMTATNSLTSVFFKIHLPRIKQGRNFRSATVMKDTSVKANPFMWGVPSWSMPSMIKNAIRKWKALLVCLSIVISSRQPNTKTSSKTRAWLRSKKRFTTNISISFVRRSNFTSRLPIIPFQPFQSVS